ncbi:MAG: acetyl-CoA carboxylase, carboxyltransferase subunit beta [Planctomycetota bacterium]
MWKVKEKKVPDGLWMRCDGCGRMVFKKIVLERLNVCPECNRHFVLTAPERIQLLLDDGSFRELDADMTSADPLHFVDRKPYSQRLLDERGKTGLNEAVVVGEGAIESRRLVVGVMDSRFIMGSMGSVVGEKVTRAFENAVRQRLPVLMVCASGGARMHEGALSLGQMAKTSAAVARHHEAGLMYVSLLTHPTYGGVTASFAFLGDVILAEPGAMIGFAGPRTILHTLKMELPKGFQTAEFLLETGFVDRIVDRKNLRKEIQRLLDLLGPTASAAPAPPSDPSSEVPS